MSTKIGKKNLTSKKKKKSSLSKFEENFVESQQEKCGKPLGKCEKIWKPGIFCILTFEDNEGQIIFESLTSFRTE